MPKFNRKIFFDGFRSRIDETIEQEQVSGLEFLLGEMENDPFWKYPNQIAYALATIFHETAYSFQPVEEGYYLGSKTRVKAFQKTLRYYPYFGRSFVQLTWETNYRKADKELKQQKPELVARFESKGEKLDLVSFPAQALDPLISYAILTLGMHQGWFTKKKLDDYIKGAKKDYKNARRIINGTDKAALIAGYAVQFEKILKDSAAVPAIRTLTDGSGDGVIGSASDTAISGKLDNTAIQPLNEPPPIIPLIPVPTEIVPQPVIAVETVSAETESTIDTTITKWSARYAAMPAAALTFLGGMWSFLTSSPVAITVTLIIAGSVIVGIYFLARMIVNSRDKARKDALQAEREARAHEILVLTIKAAADPTQNTVKVIQPPPSVILQNSDNPKNEANRVLNL